MEIVDVADENILARPPDDKITILQNPCTLADVRVDRIELRLYQTAQEGGLYHVIVACIWMGGHTIQMTYDEGYRGADPLRRAADFVTYNMGISSMITRARIALEAAIEEHSRKGA